MPPRKCEGSVLELRLQCTRSVRECTCGVLGGAGSVLGRAGVRCECAVSVLLDWGCSVLAVYLECAGIVLGCTGSVLGAYWECCGVLGVLLQGACCRAFVECWECLQCTGSVLGVFLAGPVVYWQCTWRCTSSVLGWAGSVLGCATMACAASVLGGALVERWERTGSMLAACSWLCGWCAASVPGVQL